MRLVPEIYCIDTSLIDVLLEHTPNFDIFWFHWPHDGFSWNVQDYEPIIIVYSNDGLCR